MEVEFSVSWPGLSPVYLELDSLPMFALHKGMICFDVWIWKQCRWFLCEWRSQIWPNSCLQVSCFSPHTRVRISNSSSQEFHHLCVKKSYTDEGLSRSVTKLTKGTLEWNCCAFFSVMRSSHLYKLNKLSSALQNKVMTITFQPIQRVLTEGYLKYVMHSFAFNSADREFCSHLSCRCFAEAFSHLWAWLNYSNMSLKDGSVGKAYKRTIVGRVAHEAEGVEITPITRNSTTSMSESFSQSDEERAYTVRYTKINATYA